VSSCNSNIIDYVCSYSSSIIIMHQIVVCNRLCERYNRLSLRCASFVYVMEVWKWLHVLHLHAPSNDSHKQWQRLSTPQYSSTSPTWNNKWSLCMKSLKKAHVRTFHAPCTVHFRDKNKKNDIANMTFISNFFVCMDHFWNTSRL